MTRIIRDNKESLVIISLVIGIVVTALGFMGTNFFFSIQEGVLLKQKVDIHIKAFDELKTDIKTMTTEQQKATTEIIQAISDIKK